MFAKITLLSRCGLAKLLSREKLAPTADSPKHETVGHSMHAALVARGTNVLDSFRLHVSNGWRGWRFVLSEREVDEFFVGKSSEAESVASLLSKLGAATDPSSLFCMFT